MYGKEYSKNSDILLQSFIEMNKSYKRVKKPKSGSIRKLVSIYIRLFGIPEIGFQIRSMYFQDAVKKIKPKKIKKILDAGSGIGFYSLKLSSMFPEAIVTAGEIDRKKLEFAKMFSGSKFKDKIEYKYLDITKPPRKKNTYNLIINIDVLEHIEDYKKVIKHFSNMLASKGYIYIHTPQPNQKRVFEGLRKWHHEDHIHEGYLPEDLVHELKLKGFRIISIKESFGFFGKIAWELNHLLFKKGFIISGVVYPVLYYISTLDMWFPNKKGLCTAILAQKK